MTTTLRDGWRQTTVRRVLRPLNRPAQPGLGVITAYRDGVVTLRSNRREDGYTFSDTENGYQEIRPGDLVFHALDGFAGAVGVSDSGGNASPVYHVCEPVAGDDPGYIARLLRDLGISGFLSAQAPNVRERSVDFRNWSTFARIPLVLPPAAEQRAIADYLDRETARIDTLIEEQQCLITTLRERRQGVLAAASDSDWPTASLGLVLDGIKDGTHGSFARTAPGEGMPLLGARNIMGSRVVLDGAESFIADEDYDSIVANGFPAKDDVLLVIVGATIGKTAVYDLDTRHAFQRSVAFLRPTERLQPRFLWYQIQTSRFQDELTLRSKTSAQPGIYMGDVTAIPVTLPPLEEQRRIVAHLDEQTAKIDALIAETERFIELSKERRAALITAAVTGQIDVRETV